MRRAELCRVKVEDIDSTRMLKVFGGGTSTLEVELLV
jgi:hypothetical protein